MYKQCRKDSKYKGELIKEKGESALYTPQTHTNPVTPPTAVTLFGITAVGYCVSAVRACTYV